MIVIRNRAVRRYAGHSRMPEQPQPSGSTGIVTMFLALTTLYVVNMTWIFTNVLHTANEGSASPGTFSVEKLVVGSKAGKATGTKRRATGAPDEDPFVTACDSFLSGGLGPEMTYDYDAAVSMAFDRKDAWHWGFSTRLAAHDAIAGLASDELILGYGDDVEANRGDLVLLCVNNIPSGKPPPGELKKELFLGKFMNMDQQRQKFKNGYLIVGVMGARYAPDAINGEELPAIAPHPMSSILGGGCTYGEAISVYQGDVPLLYLGHQSKEAASAKERVPVPVIPVGRLQRPDGSAFNIRDYALRRKPEVTVANKGKAHPETLPPLSSIPIYIFSGVSMNAGKSLAATHFIRGLRNAGMSVGSSKVTGTDYPKDLEYFVKGGTDYGMTFAEFGFSSTHGLPRPDLDYILEHVIQELYRAGSDVLVLELADGVRAPDARYLLGESPVLRGRMTSLFIAAQNGPGAAKALDEVFRIGLGDRLGAVTGMMMSSPLAVKEYRILESEQRRYINGTMQPEVTLYSPQELADGNICREFMRKWPASGVEIELDVGLGSRRPPVPPSQPVR